MFLSIAYPGYKELSLPTHSTLVVKDPLDLILVLAINDEWRRRWLIAVTGPEFVE